MKSNKFTTPKETLMDQINKTRDKRQKEIDESDLAASVENENGLKNSQNKKNGMNIENARNNDTDMNEEEKFDREVTKRQGGKVDDERFDTSMIERGVVDDPEAAALGGFDRKSDSADNEKLDTSMIERGVVDDPEAAALGGFDRKSEDSKEKLKRLKENVAEKRNLFAQKQYQDNKMRAKIARFFSKESKGVTDSDIESLKSDYYSALETYRKARMDSVEDEFAKVQEQSIEKQREMYEKATEEVYNEVIQEAVYKLREARQQARAEDLGGNKLVEGMKKMGSWLKESKTGKKLLLGATALGLITGSARAVMAQAPKIVTNMGLGENAAVMGGAKGMASIGKFMAPVGAGIGVGLATQWVQKKVFNYNEKRQAKEFKNKSWDEKEEFFMNRNYDMLLKRSDRLDNMKKWSAVAGAVGGAAAFMMTGDAGIEDIKTEDAPVIDKSNVENLANESIDTGDMIMSEDAYSTALGKFSTNMQGTEAFEEFKQLHGQEAHAQFLEEHEGNENAERSWQRKVDRAGHIYANRARLELDQAGISEFGDLHEGAAGDVGQKANEMMFGEVETVQGVGEKFSENIQLESSLDLANSTVDAAMGGSIISQSGVITPEQIQAAEELPMTERDKMEEYLIRLNKEGIKVDGKSVKDVLQNTTPEQVANVIEEQSVKDVVKEIIEKYEVPNDWDSHDAHNFYDESSKLAALGSQDNLSEDIIQEQNEIYSSFEKAIEDVEQQKAEIAKALEEKHARDIIYKPFKDAVATVEQQKAALAALNADHAGSNINVDLLEQRLQEAMGDVTIDIGDDAGEIELNSDSESIKGLEVKLPNGNGLLKVDAGGNVNNTLATFFQQNPDKLLKDMDHWQRPEVKSLYEDISKVDSGSEEYNKAIEKLAKIRASAISVAFEKENAGIDIHNIKAGDTFEIKMTDVGDGKTDVAIEKMTVPHIVSENTKVKFDTNNLDTANTSEAGSDVEPASPIENTDAQEIKQNSNESQQTAEDLIKESIELEKKTLVTEMFPGANHETIMKQNALELMKGNEQFRNFVKENETMRQFEGGGIVKDGETVGQYLNRMLLPDEKSVSSETIIENTPKENTWVNPDSGKQWNPGQATEAMGASFETSLNYNDLSNNESALFSKQMIDMFRDELGKGAKVSEILNRAADNPGELSGQYIEDTRSFVMHAAKELDYDPSKQSYLETQPGETVKSFYMRVAQAAKEQGKFEKVFSYSA